MLGAGWYSAKRLASEFAKCGGSAARDFKVSVMGLVSAAKGLLAVFRCVNVKNGVIELIGGVLACVPCMRR